MSAGGAWAANVAMRAYLDAQLATHVATIRTRYGETTTTLPTPDAAVCGLEWLDNANTKPPVLVVPSSGEGQQPRPYPIQDHAMDVAIKCLDALFGATGRSAIRAAAQYVEAVFLTLKSPGAGTLGNATGVLDVFVDGYDLIVQGDSNPTVVAAVRCRVRMQEA